MTESQVPLEIDCLAVKQKLDAGESLVLIDCREPDEYATVHIAESQLLPMSELMVRVGELEPHRSAQLVVHCHHGGRSMRVVHWLRQQGFAKAQSMSGGIDRWAVEIDPSLVRY